MSAVSVSSSSISWIPAVNERPPSSLLLPVAIQHVMVMYAGAVAVPFIVGRSDLSPNHVALLVSADHFAGTHRASFDLQRERAAS